MQICSLIIGTRAGVICTKKIIYQVIKKNPHKSKNVETIQKAFPDHNITNPKVNANKKPKVLSFGNNSICLNFKNSNFVIKSFQIKKEQQIKNLKYPESNDDKDTIYFEYKAQKRRNEYKRKNK